MKPTLIVVIAAVVLGLFLFLFSGGKRTPLSEIISIKDERYWGDGKPPAKADESIKPFTINVADEILEDLHKRLESTKYFRPLPVVPNDYGQSPNYTKDLVDYWLNGFDWRKQEKYLNQYDQFTTYIDGIDLHFLHVKAKNRDAKYPPKPLLLIHGWPGSVFEFYELIPRLIDPKSFGGDAKEAFDLVIPSIPGYGFSSWPRKSGFDCVEAALLFAKLMRRLGYSKYLVQGGDWGGIIGTAIGSLDPENCAGVHLNFFLPALNLRNTLTLVLAEYFPNLILTEEEQKMILPLQSKILAHFTREFGYFHLQGTRPYSVGLALTDSPAGLASYITEKFRVWSDHRGDFEHYFTKDQLLTNVMIYWATNTIVSSISFYKENCESEHFAEFMNGKKRRKTNEVLLAPVTVPVALIDFPKEIARIPEFLCKDRYVNLIAYTTVNKGGHFAALEVPQMLAEDLWKFHKNITF